MTSTAANINSFHAMEDELSTISAANGNRRDSEVSLFEDGSVLSLLDRRDSLSIYHEKGSIGSIRRTSNGLVRQDYNGGHRDSEDSFGDSFLSLIDRRDSLSIYHEKGAVDRTRRTSSGLARQDSSLRRPSFDDHDLEIFLTRSDSLQFLRRNAQGDSNDSARRTSSTVSSFDDEYLDYFVKRRDSVTLYEENGIKKVRNISSITRNTDFSDSLSTFNDEEGEDDESIASLGFNDSIDIRRQNQARRSQGGSYLRRVSSESSGNEDSILGESNGLGFNDSIDLAQNRLRNNSFNSSNSSERSFERKTVATRSRISRGSVGIAKRHSSSLFKLDEGDEGDHENRNENKNDHEYDGMEVGDIPPSNIAVERYEMSRHACKRGDIPLEFWAV